MFRHSAHQYENSLNGERITRRQDVSIEAMIMEEISVK